MFKNRSFFSKVCNDLKEKLKKGCAKLASRLLRSLCYPLLGVPSGLVSLEENKEILYPEEKIKLKSPETVGAKARSFHSEEIYHAHGLVYIPSGLATSLGGALDRRGRLVTTFLQPCDQKPSEEHDLFKFSKRRFLPKICVSHRPVISLAAGWQSAFYHWMYDVLPRFHLIEKKGLQDHLLYLECKSLFQKESLELLGIEKEAYINCAEFDAIKAPQIIVPSTSEFPTNWGCQFLKEKLLPKLKKKKKKRVYISRSDASRRRVVNEEEVFQVFKEYGFEKARLSLLTLQEQMELFYQAEAIGGPHGAGFSHLVFCDPKTPILEIFSPDYINPCYWHISNHVGLSYYYLLGLKEKNAPKEKDPDIRIDLAELRLTLKQMGL